MVLEIWMISRLKFIVEMDLVSPTVSESTGEINGTPLTREEETERLLPLFLDKIVSLSICL